jgi:hypothetical protein
MMDNIIKILKFILESSLVGVVVGFVLGKWGAQWEENNKEDQLLRNVLQEIGHNRFKCQGVNQGANATYFERFSWDNVRLHKVFLRISRDQSLTNELYQLYFEIDQANLRVGGVLVALDAQIRTPGQPADTSNHTHNILRDYLNNTLLPRLNNLEGRYSAFLRNNKLIK